MTVCPICETQTTRRVSTTAYLDCPGCGVWFQDQPPPKAYHGPDEPPVTDLDRRANDAVAAWLVSDWCKPPGRSLDIGARVPLLASALARRGFVASAMDVEFEGELLGNVNYVQEDFEHWKLVDEGEDAYDLITLVHVFEHFYDPIEVFRKLRRLAAADGVMFIRLPDHTVAGYERDLSAHHYAIHPFFHCLASISELCAQTKAFAIEWQSELQPGQRDLILRPI